MQERGRSAVGRLRRPMAGAGALLVSSLFRGSTVRALAAPDRFLRPPSSVASAFAVRWPRVLEAGRITGSEVLASFLLVIAASLPLALLLAGSRLAERPVHPSILFPRIVAEIAIAPLFVFCLGSVVCLGFAPELLLVFLLSFFPILGGAVAGFEALDPEVVDLGRSTGASARHLFLAIRLPQALPELSTGLEVGAALAATAAVVADFVVSDRGLGDLSLECDGDLETAMVYAVAILLSATSLALYRSVDFPEALHFSCYADSARPENVFREPEFRRAAGRGSGHVRRRP